jgi:hypothetical protein
MMKKRRKVAGENLDFGLAATLGPHVGHMTLYQFSDPTVHEMTVTLCQSLI